MAAVYPVPGPPFIPQPEYRDPSGGFTTPLGAGTRSTRARASVRPVTPGMGRSLTFCDYCGEADPRCPVSIEAGAWPSPAHIGTDVSTTTAAHPASTSSRAATRGWSAGSATWSAGPTSRTPRTLASAGSWSSAQPRATAAVPIGSEEWRRRWRESDIHEAGLPFHPEQGASRRRLLEGRAAGQPPTREPCARSAGSGRRRSSRSAPPWRGLGSPSVNRPRRIPGAAGGRPAQCPQPQPP